MLVSFVITIGFFDVPYGNLSYCVVLNIKLHTSVRFNAF